MGRPKKTEGESVRVQAPELAEFRRVKGSRRLEMIYQLLLKLESKTG